jgi:uncharacterized RDD family membrane protein YckC
MRPVSLAEVWRVEEPKFIREIITPEGIPVRFSIARASERAGAFMIDIVIQFVVVILLSWGLSAATGHAMSGTWLTAIVTVLSFLILNFYSAFFEVRWQGQTPGKRKIGIRVIDSRGGQLETSAVLARNLIRELEVWTPARFLLARSLLWPDAPAWATLLAVGWTFVFMFMPLFNKDRLRVGDMIAGTFVVLQPKAQLVPDLVHQAAAPPAYAPPGTKAAAMYTFTDQQLSHYGIYELQVLEGLLRSESGNMGHYEAVRTVSEKVRAKIRYPGTTFDDERFLKDFYVAQRAHLEQKMLFGKRREDKFSK